MIGFYIIASLVIVFGILSLILNNVVRAVLSFCMFLLSIASLYIFFASELIGLFQVLVYVGGIVILFLFVIMLVEGYKGQIKQLTIQRFPAAIICILTFVCFLLFLEDIRFSEIFYLFPSKIKEIASLFLNKYLLPFELLSVLLVVSLIFSVLVTKR